jgi:predicted outer membrane repeat protein
MGGAIAAPGSIEVTDCTFSSNQATNSGGAVSGENMTFTRCQFNENASQIGGALYCFSGVTSAACSTFTGNTATDGGAIMIISDAEATLAEVTITDNFARESGGGLSTSGKTYLAEAKVYGNYADKCGSDLQASNSTTIYVEDYTSLYAEELSAGNYNAYGWYLDEEDARYSADSKTEMLSITDSSLSLDSASLIFVMWTESQPSTSDTPEDEDQAPSKDSDQDQGSNTDPTPSESTDSGPSIIYPPTRHPATTPTPSTGTQEDDEETPLLVCGKAVIDNAALAEFVAGIDQSNLCQKITRGKLAFILYSLLTSDSKDMLGDDRDNAYPDLRDSSYQAEINALTEAGIFCGDSNGNFLPESTLTYGQLLTVLARLAEGDGAVMSSLENSTHWAAPSAKIAYAHGWIDDIPIDLDSPVTYGALASILNRVLAT